MKRSNSTLKKLLKGKVPGLDFLTIEHLIHSDYTLIEKLCFLYNAIKRNKYVPGMFKIGKNHFCIQR